MPKRLLTFISLLLMLLCVSLIEAQEDNTDIIQMQVEAGFNGSFRENYWLPVRIRVRNDGDALTGRLVIRPETSGRVVSNAYSTPIDLPTGSDKTTFLYIQARGTTPTIQVELLDDEGTLAGREPATLRNIAPQDILSVIVTGPTGTAIPLTGVTVGGFGAAQAIWGGNDIPENGAALEAIDFILFNNVETGELTPNQRQSLMDWVVGGGHLVVAGGPNWEGTAAGLRDFLPFVPDGSIRVSDVSALTRLSSERRGSLQGEAIVATGSVQDGARALVEVGDTPLVIRGEIGDGTVDYLALDPSLQPLRDWPQLSEMWFSLLSSAGMRPPWTEGFNDFEQAARSISILPGIDVLPPVQILCVFLGAYIFLIGPVNYFILARLNRREWAWATIPVLIVVFSLISWTVGFNLRGTEVTVSNLTVVETWPESTRAHAHQLIGVLSPRRATYSLKMTDEGRFLSVVPPLSQGNLVSLNAYQSDAEIVQTQAFSADNFSVDGGIFANFRSQTVVERPEISGRLTLQDNGDNTQSLQGSVRNDSRLTLFEPVILARGVAYHLSEPIEPGDIVTLDRDDLTIAIDEGLPQVSPLEYSYDSFNRISTLGNFGFASANNFQTVSDVMGSSYLSGRRRFDELLTGLSEKEVRRRQSFISAFMQDQYGSTGRGNRVYLMGWSQEAPLEVEIEGASWNTSNLTLYIVQLELEIERPIGTSVAITPDQFTWVTRTRENITEATLPEFTLLAGALVRLRFTPVPEAVLRRVNSLTIGFDTNTGYFNSLIIEAWNWDGARWEILDSERAREFTIPNPTRFIGPNNAVELQFRFDNAAGSARIRNLKVSHTGTF